MKVAVVEAAALPRMVPILFEEAPEIDPERVRLIIIKLPFVSCQTRPPSVPPLTSVKAIVAFTIVVFDDVFPNNPEQTAPVVVAWTVMNMFWELNL